ncbi:MAG: glycosyltransferase, partial [Deltaproteobacteria bacterium]|nr:glycosyltransferase [Deltaproteobacteria bacterium]
MGAELLRRGHAVAVLSAGGEREEVLRDKGLGIHSFPIRTKNILSPRLFFALPRIVGLVRRERFDLLHAHSRVTQVLAALVSFFTGVPFISTAHGFYRRRLGRRLFPAWGRRVVAVSPLVAEELEKTHKVARSRIRVIFNAMDTAAYRKRVLSHNPSEIRRRLGISESAFVIGSVSRLVRDKGHEYLVEAVARLRKKHEDIFLLVAGDGRERKSLEKLVRRRGLAGRSVWIPSTPDTSGLLSVMDVFAHPATYREGFGLAMLEATVAKVPVIATNIWAINSIIRNHV